jgi:outer membrane protein assembly factor BamC
MMMVNAPHRGLLLPLLLLALAVVLLGSGCARSKKPSQVTPAHLKKYLLDETAQPLKIPQGLDSMERVQNYPVPGGVPSTDRFSERVSMPDALVNPATGNIRMQSMGEESWLLADIAVAQVWPRLRSFIGVNLLPVDTIDIRESEIITKWLTPEGDLPREKYRIWIEAGLRDNTSEVHLIQANEPYLEENRNRWPEQSVDPERARIMLESIAGYLLDLRHEPIAVSAAASKIQQDSRMRILTSNEGLNELELELRFDRAWAALALALKKAEIFVLDLNRDEGIYYIAYKPDENAAREAREEAEQEAAAKKGKKKGRRKRGEENEDERVVSNNEPDIESLSRERSTPQVGTAEIIKRAKGFPRARLLVIDRRKRVLIRIQAETETEEEVGEIATQLNNVIKRISIYIS